MVLIWKVILVLGTSYLKQRYQVMGLKSTLIIMTTELCMELLNHSLVHLKLKKQCIVFVLSIYLGVALLSHGHSYVQPQQILSSKFPKEKQLEFTLENCPFLLKLNTFNHCDLKNLHLGFKCAPVDRQRILMETSSKLVKTVKNPNVNFRRDKYSGTFILEYSAAMKNATHTITSGPQRYNVE